MQILTDRLERLIGDIMKNIYGYIYQGTFIETGWSEKGAKIAATAIGAETVGYRSPINNMFIKTATKRLIFSLEGDYKIWVKA